MGYNGAYKSNQSYLLLLPNIVCSFLAKLRNTIKQLVSKAFMNMYFIVFTTNVLLSTSKQQEDTDKCFEF